MSNRPRSSNLLVLIGVTGIVAAAAVDLASAGRDVSETSNKGRSSACLPTVAAQQNTISLDFRCGRGSPKAAAASRGKAA